MGLKREWWFLIVPLCTGALIGWLGLPGAAPVVALVFAGLCVREPAIALAWSFAIVPITVPQIDVGGLHVRPFEFVVLPAAIFALLSQMAWLRQASPEYWRPLRPIGIALTYLLTASLVFWGSTSALEIHMWAAAALVMLAVFAVGRDRRFQEQLLNALSVSAMLMCAVALSQRLTGGPLFSGLTEPRDLIRMMLLHDSSPVRIANSTFGHSNAAGSYLTFLLTVLVTRILTTKPSLTVRAGAIAALTGLYLSYSRGATLAAGAAMMLVFWDTQRERARKWIVGIAGVAVLGAAAAVIPVLLVSPYVVTVSLGLRALLWRAYARAWFESPLIGLGPGNAFQEAQFLSPYGSQYGAHNNYLYVGADYGLIGLGLLVIALVIYVRRSRATASMAPKDDKPWLVATAAMILALGVHSFVDHTLTDLSYRVALLAMIGLVARLMSSQSQDELKTDVGELTNSRT